MAIIHMEGFDQYGIGATGLSNLRTSGLYTWEGSTNNAFSNFVTGRTGNGFGFGPTSFASGGTSLRHNFSTTHTVMGVGFAFYPHALTTANTTNRCMAFLSGITTRSIGFRVLADGSISVLNSSNVELGRSGAAVVLPTTWQYLEMLADSINGTLTVKVNGLTVLALTGLTIPGPFVGWWIGHTANAGVAGLWDDMVFWDNSGTVNNSFLGDRRVLTLFPTSDTSTQDWTPVGAGSGFAAINQTVPDGDVTYITTDSPGVSEFDFTNISVDIGDIAGIQVNSLERKDDAGAADVRVGLKSNSVTAFGASRPLNTSYTQRTTVIELSPDTGVKFTPSEVNATTVLIERTV